MTPKPSFGFPEGMLDAMRRANSADLCLTHFLTLCLLERDGELCMMQISQGIDASTATATVACDTLLRQQFIARRNGTGDRRRVWIRITDLGRDALMDIFQKSHDHHQTSAHEALPDFPH